eukprot:TRINITY_DN82_c0_g3_i1.p4 TRINITY_DN82_c0_g3~~TRINITY_DN82_c0_g3_i1.p4  ORF type:complete len:116 (+),score=26.12 TRINITY_DN82_c0_g3_i1:179-526(+)
MPNTATSTSTGCKPNPTLTKLTHQQQQHIPQIYLTTMGTNTNTIITTTTTTTITNITTTGTPLTNPTATTPTHSVVKAKDDGKARDVKANTMACPSTPGSMNLHYRKEHMKTFRV